MSELLFVVLTALVLEFVLRKYKATESSWASKPRKTTRLTEKRYATLLMRANRVVALKSTATPHIDPTMPSDVCPITLLCPVCLEETALAGVLPASWWKKRHWPPLDKGVCVCPMGHIGLFDADLDLPVLRKPGKRELVDLTRDVPAVRALVARSQRLPTNDFLPVTTQLAPLNYPDLHHVTGRVACWSSPG